MIQRILVIIVLVFPLAMQAEDRGATQSDWVYLQSGSNLRISIEASHYNRGWTPVSVSLAGTEVSLLMDGRGRVFKERGAGIGGRGVPLFIIDIDGGVIQLTGQSHAIRVFEQNAVRTRFTLIENAIELPLRMDGQGKGGVLNFGRLKIPARVSVSNHAFGNQPDLPDNFAEPIIAGKGHSAEAQLSVGRIRARGK
jgi:hypothetical protein